MDGSAICHRDRRHMGLEAGIDQSLSTGGSMVWGHIDSVIQLGGLSCILVNTGLR